MSVCNFNCFDCQYSDCILESVDDIDLKLENEFVDELLFPSPHNPDDIYVPSYEMYDFIPSEDIPYNPKWKSQAKWREYYRSRARGNRKDKMRFVSQVYREKNKEKIKERDRIYYLNNREKIIAYQREYLANHREENKVRCKANYLKNRKKRLEYQREYYRKHRKGE